MKKIFVFLMMLGLVLGSGRALAAIDLGAGSGGLAGKIWGNAGGDTNVNEYTLPETIGHIIQVILAFVGTIFFALTVYAGFLWMTAAGNEDKVSQAKSIITSATIGMVVVVAAYSITFFVLYLLKNSVTHVGS